jgi:hypothetical protein
VKALILILLLSVSAYADESTPKGVFFHNGQEYTKEQFDVIRPKLEAEQAAARQRGEQTACIYFGNAYVQAINIRNQWSFADPKDSYNAALSHVKAILSEYPQFNTEAIVDNVFYNPDFRYPVGGNPLLLQMSQLCMKESKQAGIKP